MSKMRMINTEYWTDPWVVDTLNPLDSHLFIYLFTNSHTNVAGIYEISLRTISSEIGIEKEELVRMMKRLEPKVHYVDGWVVLKSSIKNQNYHSPKIKTGIEIVLDKAPPELMDYIDWPKDYGAEKPKGSMQTKLISDDYSQPVDKYPVAKKATLKGVKYGMDTVSHSNVNSNSKSNTVVRTAGLKKSAGKNYIEVTLLYEDLHELVNERFKAWYCGVFFKLGREKVMRLASQARVDGKDPVKLFSHLLQKESGVKPAERLSK